MTLQEFEDYYGFISASIDDDSYFELMMNNAWKLDQCNLQREKQYFFFLSIISS